MHIATLNLIVLGKDNIVYASLAIMCLNLTLKIPFKPLLFLEAKWRIKCEGVQQIAKDAGS